MSVEHRLPTGMNDYDSRDWERTGDLINGTPSYAFQRDFWRKLHSGVPARNRQAALSPQYFPDAVTNLGQGSLETIIGQGVYTGTEYMQHRPLQMQTPVLDLPRRYGPEPHSEEYLPSTMQLYGQCDGTNSLQGLEPWGTTQGDFNIFGQTASEVRFQNIFPIENQHGGHAFLPGMLEDGGLNGFLAGPSDFAAPAPAAPQPISALYNPPSAVAIPAQARSQRPQKKQAGNELLRCPEGCKKTFRRAADLRRHMLKHGPPMYRCPFNRCDKTFYRKDKAFDHSKVHEARFRHVLIDE